VHGVKEQRPRHRRQEMAHTKKGEPTHMSCSSNLSTHST
jgi:hypothetical protein